MRNLCENRKQVACFFLSCIAGGSFGAAGAAALNETWHLGIGFLLGMGVAGTSIGCCVSAYCNNRFFPNEAPFRVHLDDDLPAVRMTQREQRGQSYGTAWLDVEAAKFYAQTKPKPPATESSVLSPKTG